MTTIENDFLKVTIRNKGGELTSIYQQGLGRGAFVAGRSEYMALACP